MKLQNKNGLERYIEVEYNNFFGPRMVMPISKVEELYEEGDRGTSKTGIETVAFFIEQFNAKYLGKSYTNETIVKKLNDEFCAIEVMCSMEITEIAKWQTDHLYFEYSKYKDDIINSGFPPPVFIASSSLCNSDDMYSLDGMHRIMSSLEAGLTSITSIIIVPRVDLWKYMGSVELTEIEEAANTCTWFPRYQELREFNLTGQRKQVPRYSEIYDFSFLKGKTVVDLGCNIGQAPLEAFFKGAKQVYGFDYQTEAINTGKKITKALKNSSILFDTIDFNNWETMDKVKEIESCDWVIFQAIYRTKEINDIEKVMEFVYNFAKEGIIFEGNADPRLDTFEFYNEKVFEKYNLKYEYLGHSEHRPVWILRK